MKTLLVAINSRNLHTNLAVRYLYVCCKAKQLEIDIFEGNINSRTEELLSQIFSKEISVYCFSTYIWNITEILKLSSSIKKLNPQAIIIFGGPEASFRYEEFIQSTCADFVLRGDGELALPELLSNLEKQLKENETLVSDMKDILQNSYEELKQVSADLLPFPYGYDEKLLPSKEQLLYYETSRGCPFSCSYCLSSAMYSVSYRSLDKVFSELKFFMEHHVPLVKFVDRTWNGNRERAKEMLRFILENPSDTKFHFEVAGDLFDRELLDLLKNLPCEAVQLEIGVQSANTLALEAACRTTDLDKLRSNVTEIISWGNIHVHLDLIAGLPYEDFESFGHSFDYVFHMEAQMLQLGFLKLLHGSSLKQNKTQYGIVANDFPPYEVLYTKNISYMELLQLKRLEDVLEQYYNSGRNRMVIDYLIHQYGFRPFLFFKEFSEFLEQEDFFKRKQGPKDSFSFLYDFFKRKVILYKNIMTPPLSDDTTATDICFGVTFDTEGTVIQLMRYDWIISGINSPSPDFMKASENESIKKHMLSSFTIPKECNWFLASKPTIDYLIENTKVLSLRESTVSMLKKTDSLLFIFNSTKGKKTSPKLLDVVVFNLDPLNSTS